jgi:hypothetical protein
MLLCTPGGQSVSQTYTYDPSSKRLQTITVNGVTLIYSYINDSNQIGGISAEASGGNGLNLGVSETFSPDSADGSRLGEISVDTTTDAGHGNTNVQTVYDASYTYNNDNQRATDVVTQTDSDGNATSQTLNYTYDPTQADALTLVQDGSGNVLYNYGYDGTGNFAGTDLGDANSVNEYSNLTYNARHDLTNDGTYAYGYDALDRLTSVTPDSPSSGSTMEQYGYDGQGRRLWEDVYTYNISGGSWGLSFLRHFVWSGSELVAELDGNNDLLQQYTWGQGEDGTDQVIALTDYTSGAAHTYALVYDASGNAAMMLDPTTGAVVGNYSYTPYGALVSASGPEAGLNPWLGKGQWVDPRVPQLGWAEPDVADGTTRITQQQLGFWLQDDPTGINGGLNRKSVDGDDPINNIDPNGTTYREIIGVAGVRWNETDQRAEMGLEVAIHPSWYNYIFGVSDTDRSAAATVQWIPITSLPKEYASVQGLQRLANWDKQPIRDQSAPSILVNVAFELARHEAVQQALTEGLNAAGPTGLGPTGEGLATAALLEALSSILKTVQTVRTAESVVTGIELGARADGELGATCCQRIAPLGAASNTIFVDSHLMVWPLPWHRPLPWL